MSTSDVVGVEVRRSRGRFALCGGELRLVGARPHRGVRRAPLVCQRRPRTAAAASESIEDDDSCEKCLVPRAPEREAGDGNRVASSGPGMRGQFPENCRDPWDVLTCPMRVARLHLSPEREEPLLAGCEQRFFGGGVSTC